MKENMNAQFSIVINEESLDTTMFLTTVGEIALLL